MVNPERWKFATRISKNGATEVWSAKDSISDDDVIIKLVTESMTPERLALIGQEANHLGNLNSPQFPRLVHFEQSSDRAALVVQHLPGVSLKQLLVNGPLPWREATSIIVGILEAVEELHARSVVQGNLRPETIRVDSGRVGICDLGFFRRVEQAILPSGSTPLYAAPEQIGLLSEAEGPWTDLYTIGLIFVELLQAQPIWREPACWNERLSPRLEILPPLPPSLRQALERLLGSRPAQRYRTAASVRHDLLQILASPDGYHALGSKDIRSVLTEPAFIGRNKELALLRDFLDEKDSSILKLAAPSGYGKSSLLKVFAQEATDRGYRVHRARGEGPFEGMSPDLTGLLSSVVDELASGGHKKVGHVLGSRAQTLARAFPRLASFWSPSSNLEPGTLAVLDALSSLFEALGRRAPRLLIIDDAQWVRAIVLEWLSRSFSDRIKVVVSYRSQVNGVEESLLELPGNHVVLEPLGMTEAASLLTSMAGPLPQSATSVILDRAKGEPFWLCSLLQGAVEKRLLTPGSQGWEWSEDGELQTTLRLGVQLAERLSFLAHETLELLEAGAVLGCRFSLDEASEIVKTSRGAAEVSLSVCVERRLVWKNGDRVEFTHDKIREAVLAGLEAPAVQSLHHKTVACLERRQSTDYLRLARHSSRTPDSRRTLDFSRRGARQATMELDFDSAIELLELSLESGEDLPDVEIVEIWWELARAHARRSQFEKAAYRYRQVLGHTVQPLEKLAATGELCDSLAKNAQIGLAGNLVREALAVTARPVPASRLQQILESVVAWSYFLFRSGASESPQSPTVEARALARVYRSGSEAWSVSGNIPLTLWATANGCLHSSRGAPESAISIGHAGILSVMFGHLTRAEKLFRQAEDLAQGDARSLGEILGQSFYLSIAKGDLRDSIRRLEASIELCSLQGDAWNQGIALGVISQVMQYMGDFRGAIEKARLAISNPRMVDTVICTASRVLALVGDEKSFPSIQEIGDRYEVPRLANLSGQARGIASLHQGRYREAISYLERAVAVQEPGAFFFGAASSSWLATSWRVFAEKQPPENSHVRRQALRQAFRAVQDAQSSNKRWLVNQPHVLREYALCSAHWGRTFLARSLFEKSYALSERLGMPFESAWTLYERGRFAQVSGWPDWKDDQAEGMARVRQLGGWLPGVDLSIPEPQRHMAKLDRFDRVLEGGRRLVALDVEEQVLKAFEDEAKSLLRCDRVLLVKVGHRPNELSRALYERCIAEGRAVTESEELSKSLLLHEARSTLMAPLRVEGQHHGLLVAWQKSIGGFFGEEETRLADYLCALAGAGLENARILAQRQRTFQALQTSEERFRGFFDYAGVGTALLDDSGVILQENPYLQALLGGSSLGKTPWQLAHAADREEFKSGFATLCDESSHRYDSEVRLHRSGGEVAWTQSCLVALPVRDGDESRYLLTVADITHRRIAEMMEFLENERRSLAAEVHDELAQDLAALHMLLAGLKSEDSGVRRATEMARKLVDDTTNLMASLRNPLAEGVDLLAALKSLVANFSVECEAEVEVRWPEQALPLSDLAALVLYRVLQEGLTNIRKHAQATSVLLCFRLLPGHLEVTLKDNGCGFDASVWLDRRSVGRHFGLLSMRDRTEMVGGNLQLLAGDGGGCTLLATLPCQ